MPPWKKFSKFINRYSVNLIVLIEKYLISPNGHFLDLLITMTSHAQLQFHWADYLVCFISLAASLVIGFIFMCTGAKQKSSKEILIGEGSINPFAVGLSLTASLLNAVFLIGGPAEIYYYGTVYSLVAVSVVINAVIASEVFVPVYRRIETVSAYEYLERRFETIAPRLGASLVFAIQIIVFLSVVLYAPAFAFEQVTGLPLDVMLAVCGIVCTLYVVVGGIKAVVWTDTVQMIIVIIGMLTLVIKGTLDVPGQGATVWERAVAGGRINFNVADPDPRVRHSIWTQCFGNTFILMSLYGSNQMIIQRFHAVKSDTHAKLAICCMAVFTLLIVVLVVMLGLVMYAYYNGPGGCDPLIGGRVTRGDQVVPLFLMETLGSYHGLPGLFAASVFAAALSSVSSAVNSLAAVFLEDFIKPIHKKATKGEKEILDNHCVWITRGLSLFFGLLTIGLSYGAKFMGPNLIQIPTAILGVIASPVFSMFVLALFVPCSNGYGALIGMIVGLTINLWGWLSGILYAPSPAILPKLGLNCTTFNIPASQSTNYPPAIEFYKMSYVWYGLFGLVISTTTGLIAGCIIDAIGKKLGKRTRPEHVDPNLLFPISEKCCCYCPASFKALINRDRGIGSKIDKDGSSTKDDSELKYMSITTDKDASGVVYPAFSGESSTQPHENGRSHSQDQKLI